MTLAFAALTGGIILLVTGWKGWSLNDFFSEDRPAGTTGFQGEESIIAGVAAGPPQPGAPTVKDAALLEALAKAAKTFGLTVTGYGPWGIVTGGHVTNSYHYRNRAFDASGPADRCRAFANYVADNFGTRITELYWNGAGCRNIKDGQPAKCGFVSGHTKHVHVAI